MRTWTRSETFTLCGRCGKRIRRGDPMLLIRIAGSFFHLTQSKRRCAECAHEPVPEDLPAIGDKPTPKPIVPARFTADCLPLDWKSKAAGREPGEDG